MTPLSRGKDLRRSTMKFFRGFDDPSAYSGGYVAIGNFDGVHLGHRSMMARLVGNARSAGVPAVVFTFDPHPIAILRAGAAPPSLTTLDRKLELLDACGADCVIAWRTDAALLSLTPREFFDRIILQELAARGLVEGPNFFFGHNRAGSVATLQEFCDAAGITLDVVPPLKVGDHLVSSSEVRRLITAGRVAEARGLLGAGYQIQGVVSRGAERGRTIGFPTANLEQVAAVLPAEGVYAGRAWHASQMFAAGINIGPNPTFGEQARKIEVHLIDFAGDLYGQTLRVEFIDRLRDTTRFDGLDALKSQLHADMHAARTLANTEPAG